MKASGGRATWITGVIVAACTISVIGGTDAEPVEAVTTGVSASVCLVDTEPARLDTLFDTEPAGVVGADYQRALTMPDGRVLWTFQDAAVRLGPDDITIVHNIAVLQEGSCFTVMYGGSGAAPEPYFFADRTEPFRRWFWPLDSVSGNDGRVYVYAAEMEERGAQYLSHVVPVGTSIAVFDPVADEVVAEAVPTNPSASLYGWSITSDDTWTYLYAQCYRQFGFDEFAFVAAFDRSCATDVTVARVPRGELFEPMAYWDGSGWQPDPSRAVSIITSAGRRINANQFEWTGARFVSVNKEGDWWGKSILLAESTSPTGPFHVYAELTAPVKCAECNSFFATWVTAAASRRQDDTFTIALSHNRWDGVVSSLYRPSFHRVPAPSFLAPSSTFEVQVEPGAEAAAITVTVVDPTDEGFVTAYPCELGLPLASNVNHVNEPVVANLVLARPDDEGRVCLYSLAETNLVVDMAGTFPAGSALVAADPPARLVDTRSGEGGAPPRPGAGEVYRLEVPLPENARAAALNVAAVDPSGPGFLTVFPCDRPQPGTSNVNYVSEPVVSNLVITSASSDAMVCVYSLEAVDLVVDFAGSLGGGYEALPDAVRVADTRDGVPTSRTPEGGVLEIDVSDHAGPSATVVLNVIAVDPSTPGFLTVFPCDADRPLASNVNYTDVSVVANLVLAEPSADGRVCVFTSAETDIVVDLAGRLTGTSGYESLDVPERLVDTRVGTGVPGQLGLG